MMRCWETAAELTLPQADAAPEGIGAELRQALRQLRGAQPGAAEKGFGVDLFNSAAKLGTV